MCSTPSQQLTWSGLALLDLALTINQGLGGPKQSLEKIYSLNCDTRQKFHKTKVVRKVCFRGGRSYFWACNPDLEGPGPHVLLEPWSIIFKQILIYKMCSTPSQQSTWSGLDLLDLALTINQGSGGPKQGLEKIYSLNCDSRQKFHKTKVVGKVCFREGGSYFWARNLDLEGPGLHVLLEPWSIIFRQILINQSCSAPSQQQTLAVMDLPDLAMTLNQESGGP